MKDRLKAEGHSKNGSHCLKNVLCNTFLCVCIIVHDLHIMNVLINTLLNMCSCTYMSTS